MRAFLILSLALLTACARPLTPSEAAFASDLQGDTINTKPVRIIADVPFSAVTFKRQKRPRLACRERIFPEPVESIVTVTPAAVVLWNTPLFGKGWHKPDFLAGYPAHFDLADAMLFAHEITHVWQWQNRAVTGYSPWRAAREHQPGADPYLFDISTKAGFLDYGFEQQASIVEEYVCCTVLDPDAPRTARLEAMLREVMPLGDLPRPKTVMLPWKDAQIQGICS